MNKKDISNKLQYVFEGLEISKKKKLYLTEVFTSIIETAVEGIETPEIKQATSDKIGGVKIGYVANNKNYPILLDNYSKAYVAVPWTDTKYSAATESNLGLVKQAAAISPVDGAAELSTVISVVNTLISNLQSAGIIKQ